VERLSLHGQRDGTHKVVDIDSNFVSELSSDNGVELLLLGRVEERLPSLLVRVSSDGSLRLELEFQIIHGVLEEFERSRSRLSEKVEVGVGGGDERSNDFESRLGRDLLLGDESLKKCLG